MSTRTRFSALLVAFSLALSATTARADDDDPSLAQYRERFKQGLDRYEASDVAGALSFWEPLYRDLGPSRGYRVGYNLARAYEVAFDMTRAAERYQSFLDEVKRLRDSGKPIDDVVAADETKATARLEEIARTRARIRVPPTTPPESVRIDQSEPRLAGFVAYVAPGAHDVVFAPDTSHAHREHVEVQAGQLVEVEAPKPEVVAVKPVAHATTWSDAVARPFAPGYLWLAGAVTVLVGGGVTGGAYANALAMHDRYASQGPTPTQVNDYQDARTFAYASWAVPATLVVVTAVLAAWYAIGSKHVKVPQVGALSF